MQLTESAATVASVAASLAHSRTLPPLTELIPNAQSELCTILSSARGLVQPPIRAEIFGSQRFAQHGRSLGLTHSAAKVSARAASFFPRLRSNITALREAHRYIGVQASTGYDISPAAEWLLDNFHLIEAQLKEIHEGLPRSYFRSLPMLQEEPLAGLPRVYGIAWAFVAHTDGAFDENLLIEFLLAYQETRELNLSEIWALPTTLRVVLVENLRRLSERVATNKAAREVANLCCDKIENYTLQALDQLLALLNQRGVGHVFLAQMAQRLQNRNTHPHPNDRADYLGWLQSALPNLADVQAQQPAKQAADNLSVSNAVTSLRAIGDADWPDIVCRTSTLMRMMLTSPVFEAEDISTRDQTLHDIERLARRTKHSEVAVAQALLSLMPSSHSQKPDQPHERRIGDHDPIESVASYWLNGDGLPDLVQAVGLPARMAFPWRQEFKRMMLPAYLTAVVFGTLSLVIWLLPDAALDQTLPTFFTPVWLMVLGIVLMLFPASETAVAVIHRVISESVKPKHLPRLALGLGIPPEHRVMVVMPTMLTSAKSAPALAHRLLLHYLANPEPQAQFALLTDWADADTEHVDNDSTLLASAVAEIQALNARYPQPGATPRFILLHRQRHFSPTEQAWIGWERKRGKLELLISALATGTGTGTGTNAGTDFLSLGESSRIAPHTRYVLTLDSDTQLPPGRLRELVGVAAHPSNQPQLDATGRTVVRGYGILQPRIVTPLPAAKEFTLFHWLFAGHCGVDPYSAATSEVYQDVFGEGSFTGKGLLNVQALHAVLCGRLPQGQVLSHDLLEGSLARCAAVTDITLIEDSPSHADVAASRVHRWTRGDWQLLPFLLHPARYPMRLINRWKMLDNLRRSLVAPMSLALMLLTLAGYVMSPWTALGLIVAAFSAGPLMGAVVGFAPSRDDLAKLNFYRQAGIDLARVLWGGLWHVTQLLQQAIMAMDAIGRALHRMGVSHRNLLQWTTAESAQAQASNGLRATWRRHRRLTGIALAAWLALLLWPTPAPAMASGLCLLWAASPLWTWWVSRPSRAAEDIALDPEDRAYLEGIARDTWRYFERCVVADDKFLPPDNLQVLPHDMVAHRTSPTNIGLYLLSATCARQFGWIGTQELLTRLEATVVSMGTLQRHRGHFLNWYDTQTGEPLLPMYVSTVDSGNLCGHLLAVAQACRELSAAPDSDKVVADSKDALVAGRLLTLAQTCERIAGEADFSFLYHAKRHLLHIGYRVAEQQLDASFYDLLASESRLTSLFAIAKGDVPVRHWSALGRPFYAVGAKAALRSWSGSMFEYLMPTLVLHEPPGSVLHRACHAAILEQMAFANPLAVPWGISESAYAASDHTLAYQYAPQGVPRLALRRTPANELVVAPYATALAAQITPGDAIDNFELLASLAARKDYGFIEALDYSPSRQTGDEPFIPVATFMAHHQGMTIVAIANVLLNGVAQRWGMGNPQIEAVSSLLHERAPREISTLHEPPSGIAQQVMQRRRRLRLLRDVVPGAATPEPTHVMSNGRYSVTVRANGAGWSRWGQFGITRWRDDALRDSYGSFFYLRRHNQAMPVSITQHPAPDPVAHYKSTFHADRVCFDATWPDVQVHTTVWISPEDDIEFRKVEIHNLSDRPMEIELISAFDVTLTDPRADEAHPAFTNLFVRAHWDSEQQALKFERKPRLPSEPSLQAVHFLADTNSPDEVKSQGQAQVLSVTYQTDRQLWLGRNHAASQPVAEMMPLPTSQRDSTLNTGLDPVCALSVRVRIAANGKVQLTFATAASDSMSTLHAVIDKYHQSSHIQRASLMSATLAGIRLHALRISGDNFIAVQTLTTALVMNLTHAHARVVRFEGAALEVCDRRLLWRLGISGDRPLLLVTAAVTQGLGLLRSLSQALRLWTWGGIQCDMVVINAEPASYLMELHREIAALRERHLVDSSAQPGPASTAFHLLRADELSGDELSTLQSLARVQFNADGRPLTHHVQEWSELHASAAVQRRSQAHTQVALASGGRSAPAVATGTFSTDNGDFTFDVSAKLRPQRPWINVLANSGFGAQISESGGGYTWALNSRMNQLTAWSNDPVADPPSEWFVLQDRKTLEAWSVTPNAWGSEPTTYKVTHGQGISTISHRRGDLAVTASWCVDAHSAVKQVRLHVVNHGPRTQRLRAIGMVEWVMGANRVDKRTVYTRKVHDELTSDGDRLTALLSTQTDRSAGFGNGTAFFAIATPADAVENWTCDRREFFDDKGFFVLPDQLAQAEGAGLDPCAALSTLFRLGAGESIEQVFLLGYADSPRAAQTLAAEAALAPAHSRLATVSETWNALLGHVAVKTPDPLFDVMVNRWLLYQTVSCRLWAKAGFYQAGGATGYRDQLQDTMALAWAAPAMLRDQIALCAARQFAEGDVQHWWHAPTGAGVRTHFSDDLLWLPYATAHYLRVTGDVGLLNQAVPFLEGASIPEGAEDAYYTPGTAKQTASVYEHGARAIDRSLRVGVHGLPLMGSGDWNDGMNRVGIEGRGESVWLGWFLCTVVAGYAPLARERGELVRAQTWETAAQGWTQALMGAAWDGQWFKRAFFDNGEPLGSSANAEGRIDLIAQAWATLSGIAPPDKQQAALASMEAYLMDPEAGLIRLLDPPLVNAVPSAGYIQAYPPGVRENGGQYSHGAIWALMAQAEWAHQDPTSTQAGIDKVWRSFTWLSPAHRASHPVQGPAYGLEPYVMAGDVYTQPPYVGRGGWSWYTGAAAWMHRAAIESLFGLQIGATDLSFNPCLPSHWPQAELTLRRDHLSLRFFLVRGNAPTALAATSQWNAQLLAVGQTLRWVDAADQSCFVLALSDK